MALQGGGFRLCLKEDFKWIFLGDGLFKVLESCKNLYFVNIMLDIVHASLNIIEYCYILL